MFTAGPEMKERLERHGLIMSSRGSEGRRGPTIGMAMVSLAHFDYPEVQMFRLGAMAPMYPFVVSNNEQLGIFRDHRSFYDIMRRLKAMFRLDIDLSELLSLGGVGIPGPAGKPGPDCGEQRRGQANHRAGPFRL